MGGKYTPDEDECNLVPDSPSAYDIAEDSGSNFGGTDEEVITEDGPGDDIDGEMIAEGDSAAVGCEKYL